jgi:hypothetical protein
MYFHPLQEEIGNMSDEDISKGSKNFHARWPRPGDGAGIQRCWHNCNTHYDIPERHQGETIEAWHKNNKKLRNEPDLGDLVNMD